MMDFIQIENINNTGLWERFLFILKIANLEVQEYPK